MFACSFMRDSKKEFKASLYSYFFSRYKTLMNETSPNHIFPNTRLRRTRSAGWIRNMVRETNLAPNDLISPLFVLEGAGREEEVESLPGVARRSIDLTIEHCKEIRDLGIPAVALFPVVEADKKDKTGSESRNQDNLMCRAISAIKAALPDLGIITDVALDPYTTHGHDGVMRDDYIVNDETVALLVKQAMVQAQAGADIIAPSDMMDGRVAAIRKALEENKFYNTMILSYAAKYASGFYGPFRDAVGSADTLQGNKKSYQMDPANTDEAMREIALDIAEGADMVMVKPGGPYMDIIARAKTSFNVPLFAYHVSGEYAGLKAAAANEWLDYDICLAETLLGFKRAGCAGILTYGAMDMARLLQGQ